MLLAGPGTAAIAILGGPAAWALVDSAGCTVDTFRSQLRADDTFRSQLRADDITALHVAQCHRFRWS